MNFKKWLLKFLEVDLPIGDLAREVSEDINFPISNNYKEIINYLTTCGIGDAQIITYNNAWKYYQLEYYYLIDKAEIV